MKKNYFIIGGGHLQLSYIEVIKNEGFFAHVFDVDPNCPGSKIADKFHNISIDEKEKILKIAKKYKPIAIHSVATEQGNLTSCYVSEKMSLFSNLYSTAVNTTDKTKMKYICNNNKISTAAYNEFTNINDINTKSFNYPVIVKPSDRSAGRGVSLARNKKELKIKYLEAQNYSYNNKIIIEEYVEGDQFSLETISLEANHSLVATCKMTFNGPPNFVEYKHHLPAIIDEKKKKKLEIFAFQVLDAFKIKYGASHLEVRINEKEEIKLIEIASRMGGWRDWMIKAATGFDYCKAILNSSLNKPYKQTNIDTKKVSVAQTIITKTDYDEYKVRKKKYKNNFVKDLVKKDKNSRFVKNLVECDGPYIICLKLNEAKELIN